MSQRPPAASPGARNRCLRLQPAAVTRSICNTPALFPQQPGLVSQSLQLAQEKPRDGRDQTVTATTGTWGRDGGSGAASPALKLRVLSAIIWGKNWSWEGGRMGGI